MVPHNGKRFPGSSAGKDWEGSPETVRDYIVGGHVATYMKHLQENDADAYKSRFSSFIKAGVTADSLEGMYTKAHAAIRADPNKARGDLELGAFKTRSKKSTGKPDKHGSLHRRKRSVQQRHGRIRQILTAAKVPFYEKKMIRQTRT
jgi:large subunit ribosomal protein L5e